MDDPVTKLVDSPSELRFTSEIKRAAPGLAETHEREAEDEETAVMRLLLE